MAQLSHRKRVNPWRRPRRPGEDQTGKDGGKTNGGKGDLIMMCLLLNSYHVNDVRATIIMFKVIISVGDKTTISDVFKSIFQKRGH